MPPLEDFPTSSGRLAFVGFVITLGVSVSACATDSAKPGGQGLNAGDGGTDSAVRSDEAGADAPTAVMGNGLEASGDSTVASDTGTYEASIESGSESSVTGGQDSGSGCTPACAAGLVCERYGGASCVDPNWAEWPMPNAPSYTANPDGTVTDNVTGLIWQVALPNDCTQAVALAYCAGLGPGWRLPSLVELVSILDLSVHNPSIDTTTFPGTPAHGFWSSTPYAGMPNSLWVVNFGFGNTGGSGLSDVMAVRCVR